MYNVKILHSMQELLVGCIVIRQHVSLFNHKLDYACVLQRIVLILEEILHDLMN